MPFPFVLLICAAPPDPTAGAALLSAELRWPALAAVARVRPGQEAGPVASAVCVGRKGGHVYLLTANHALPKGEARTFEFFTKASYPEPAQTLIGSDAVVRLPGPDVALVKVFAGTDEVPSLSLAAAGQRPKRFPTAGVSIGCPEGSPPVFRAEKLTSKKWVRRENVEPAFYWETTVPPVIGMSGGPLLHATGKVIGLCTAAGDGRGYFAHLDEIHAGLKQNGYGWLFETRDEKGPP